MDPEYGGSDEEDAEAQANGCCHGILQLWVAQPAAKKRKFIQPQTLYVEGETS